MSSWRITWFDGMNLREVCVVSDVFNLITAVTCAGVNVSALIKIERVPT